VTGAATLVINQHACLRHYVAALLSIVGVVGSTVAGGTCRLTTHVED